MKVSFSGEYDKRIYWLNKWSWVCVFLSLAVLASCAVDNSPFIGLLAYIAMAMNMYAIHVNRDRFLENEIFRLGKIILNERGNWNGDDF